MIAIEMTITIASKRGNHIGRKRFLNGGQRLEARRDIAGVPLLKNDSVSLISRLKNISAHFTPSV